MKQIQAKKRAAETTLTYKAEVQVEKTVINYRNDHRK
jgi:hypothetical protein